MGEEKHDKLSKCCGKYVETYNGMYLVTPGGLHYCPECNSPCEVLDEPVEEKCNERIEKARQEERERVLKIVADIEKREFEQWSTKHSEFIRVSDSTKRNILTAVKEVLEAESK